MNRPTQLEDLSNEIFFEIFDYFHALDIFISFTSLNQRFTSILHTIPLRVVIRPTYSRRQIDFLSSHLRLHAHQVISLKISDHILNYSSTISLIFSRHKFINLQLCSFTSIISSQEVFNVIRRMKSLDKLVSFTINQNVGNKVDDKFIHRLFESMLLHRSSYLRSLVLGMKYDYRYLSKYSSISSNLRSLQIHIFSSQSISPFDSVPFILRLCRSLQDFDLRLECEELFTSSFSKSVFRTNSSYLDHIFRFLL